MTLSLEFGIDTFGDVTADSAGNRLSQAQVTRNVVEEAVLADSIGIDFVGDPNAVQRAGYFSSGSIMMFASLPIALWGIVELGILPGTKGPNRFGDDPLPPRA